jgi:hypothetical protein
VNSASASAVRATASCTSASGLLIVLLHVFEKNSAGIPPRESAIANQRFADFRARMDAKPRRRPRAAGHDAP